MMLLLLVAIYIHNKYSYTHLVLWFFFSISVSHSVCSRKNDEARMQKGAWFYYLSVFNQLNSVEKWYLLVCQHLQFTFILLLLNRKRIILYAVFWWIEPLIMRYWSWTRTIPSCQITKQHINNHNQHFFAVQVDSSVKRKWFISEWKFKQIERKRINIIAFSIKSTYKCNYNWCN